MASLVRQLSQESAQGAHLGRSSSHLDFGEAGFDSVGSLSVEAEVDDVTAPGVGLEVDVAPLVVDGDSCVVPFAAWPVQTLTW